MSRVTGRFAPSPTGPLHFGSLVAATASYLAARHAGEPWLVRIEDIDPPRVRPGATGNILRTLEAFGFVWDSPVLYQSQRLDAYHEALDHLQTHTYPCTCSRKTLQIQGQAGAYGPVYPGTCRHRFTADRTAAATRVRTPDEPVCFTDRIRGRYCQHLGSEIGDFVLRRADGIVAYQLAVVVDDAYQGITQIVRGADLLDNTPRQIYLQQLLKLPQPDYAHVPLAVTPDGQKLSKQNLAPALPTRQRLHTLVQALQFLGQCPDPKDFSTLDECWAWAIAHWHLSAVPRLHARTVHQYPHEAT